ncbi:MAG: DUF3040 domain-containing protein [Demequinaceae bacterium]|nr:DUF3040 domain-containing protein [Demequinaceae bacterium]
MPLSEHEQRVLEQLERDLGADPKLGRSMAQGPRKRGRIALGVVGVIAGLGVVLIGVVAAIVPLGIVGFALMTAAAMWAIFAPSRPTLSVVGSSKASSGPKRTKEPFIRRVENRLERRREQGDL